MTEQTTTQRPSASDSTRGFNDHVLAVVGPTGVGKTAVAEELAVRLGGEIVSADSMQIYRGMDIGTAKQPEGLRRVPYHGIDLVDPGSAYSAALFQREARRDFESIWSSGCLPVLAGGTGLYVRAALDDMDFPAGKQEANPVRDHLESYVAQHGAAALHGMLESRDAKAAALIHPNNVRRVIRALEMLESGVSYAQQHEGFSARRSLFRTVFVGLEMERSELYRRVDLRVDGMIAAGLLDEVERLLAKGLRSALTAQQAIGYKELVPVLEGEASLDEAVESIKQATRRYAKRQLTWFRADPRVKWVDVTERDVNEAADAALAAIDWCDR